jgi:DNA-binding transcriptional LysR family regulator
MVYLPFTLDQLRIFKSVTVEGNFRKAASNMYISQPAVSSQIHNLEKQLNVLIFDRGTKKITLTEEGQMLLRYTNRILLLCDETCRAIEDLHNLDGGTLTIGASQTTGTYLMPRLIGLFRQKYPQVNVQLQVHSTRRIAWSVASGHLNLAIVGGEIPHELKNILQITSYAEDELALILPKSHPFSMLTVLQKEDLYRLRFITLDKQSTIRKVIDRVLSQNGIDSARFKTEMELNSIEAIKNAVQAGLGASFVSVSSISKELELGVIQWVKVENILIKRTLSIIINPKTYRSKASEIFNKEMLSLFVPPQHAH